MDLFNGLTARMDYDTRAFEVRFQDFTVNLKLVKENRLKVTMTFPAKDRFVQKPTK